MKRVKTLGAIFLMLLAIGLTSCASSKSDTATEVEPTPEELAQQEMEELARLEQDELDALRAEEEASQQEVRQMEFDPSQLKVVHFDFDQYSLMAEARAALASNAEWLKDNPDAVIQIEGHCDERGTNDYNLALGEKRATVAKSYLISLGVDEARIYTISYGEERPSDTGHNKTAWSQNRRAEFKLTTK